MADEPDSVPKDFGLKYVLWYMWLGLLGFFKFLQTAALFAWRNAITLLSTACAVFTGLTTDPNQTLVSHETFHYVLLVNFVLTIILAQIKRTTPPTEKPP
jgi:hypothetical protein